MHKALAFAVFLIVQPASAQAATNWLCHLSDDLVRLVCIAEPPAAEPVTESAPVGVSASPTAVVNGTRFPLDGGRLWTVEVWSPPTEFAFVERLARATICYRSPGCSVTVLPWRRG